MQLGHWLEVGREAVCYFGWLGLTTHVNQMRLFWLGVKVTEEEMVKGTDEEQKQRWSEGKMNKGRQNENNAGEERRRNKRLRRSQMSGRT